MKEIGSDKAYDELVYTPGKYHIRRHFVKSYKCPKCGENPENDANHTDDIEKCNIRRAEYPKPMIPGSFCSPELLAQIRQSRTDVPSGKRSRVQAYLPSASHHVKLDRRRRKGMVHADRGEYA